MVQSETVPSNLETEKPEGMFYPLQVSEGFRWLMFGTFGSSTAFWMYNVAVGWLALELTDSAFFVGLTGFVGGIPMLVLSIPGGVLIDRYGRKRILFLAQVSVGILSTIMAIIVGLGAIQEWSLLLLVFLNGTAMTFTFPTRNAIVPALVEKRLLASAIALNSASHNSTRVFGPSLAGVLIAVTNESTTFAVAAFMQMFAIYATWRIQVPGEVARRNVGRMLDSIAEGFRLVATTPALKAIVLLALAPNVLVMPYMNLMPVFAKDVMDLGSTGLGVMLASAGVGTLVGSLHVARSSYMRDDPRVQVASGLGFAAATLGFAFSPNLWIALPLLFLGGWACAAFLALNQTSLQLNVDDALRGRVMSIYMLTWGVLPVGQLGIGALADLIGTPRALGLSCLLALIVCWWIAQRHGLTSKSEAGAR